MSKKRTGYFFGLFKFGPSVMLWAVLILASLGPLYRWTFLGSISGLLSDASGNTLPVIHTSNQYDHVHGEFGLNNPVQALSTVTQQSMQQQIGQPKTHPYQASYFLPVPGVSSSNTASYTRKNA